MFWCFGGLVSWWSGELVFWCFGGLVSWWSGGIVLAVGAACPQELHRNLSIGQREFELSLSNSLDSSLFANLLERCDFLCLGLVHFLESFHPHDALIGLDV